jgi:hypothetical protein
MTTVICDFYSPLNDAISYSFVLVYILGLGYCNGLMGENDLFGFGKFVYMKPEGFTYPIVTAWGTGWPYEYTSHPLYWLNTMYIVTQGTTLTYGSLAWKTGFFVYNFVGALIETWRFKDEGKEKDS